jgi:hypothetical protein
MTTKVGDKGTALLWMDLFYHFISAIETKNANLLSVEWSQIVDVRKRSETTMVIVCRYLRL